MKNADWSCTAGDSCGGPTLTMYETRPLDSEDPVSRIDVDVPIGTAYYVTVYGVPAE